MPIYEYSCVITGEIAEVILPLADWDKKQVVCPVHHKRLYDENSLMGGVITHNAERVWSAPANISIGKPTKIFRNLKTGEAQVALGDFDSAPEGFVTEELRNPIERSQFEKEQNERRNAENEVTSEYLKSQREGTTKNRHDDIKSRISSYDNQTQGLLKAAMNYTRKKEKRIPPKRTNIRLDVNHLDSGSMKREK